MEVRTAASPKDVKHYTTDRLREEFLIQDLFQADKINLVYSHIDRIITGAAVPVNEKLVLTAGDELRAEYFLQRRELGIINIGGDGIITIDGRVYEVNARDGMYVGRGAKDISFESKDASCPAILNAFRRSMRSPVYSFFLCASISAHFRYCCSSTTLNSFCVIL